VSSTKLFDESSRSRVTVPEVAWIVSPMCCPFSSMVKKLATANGPGIVGMLVIG